MSLEAIKENIQQSRKIVRELYVLTTQLDNIKNLEDKSNSLINVKEKKLLLQAIDSLINQLRILNESIPEILKNISFFKSLKYSEPPEKKKKLIQLSYNIGPREKTSLTISEKDKKQFLENLSKSNFSIEELRKKYSVEKPSTDFGKPNLYGKISNRLFRNFSNNLVSKGYLNSLNNSLRKTNSPFVVSTYGSMIILSMLIAFLASIILFGFLLFYHVHLLDITNLLTRVTGSIFLRALKFFWILMVIPAAVGAIIYYNPISEQKNLGAKIDQELPFVTIHMSAVATSGVEPVSIFKIILRSQEYNYTNKEFRKILNLVNFHGYDIVTALKQAAKTSPSTKLRELLSGLATTLTSGGDIRQFLNSHSDGLLFDYRLEREKYTKTAETFMDIYISIVIAAPMILLVLFVIIGSSGLSFMGIDTNIMGYLIILGIVILNLGFLVFLHMKQPSF